MHKKRVCSQPRHFQKGADGEITATPSALWPPPCCPDRPRTSPGTHGGSCIAGEEGRDAVSPQREDFKSDGLRNGASSGRHLHSLDGSSPSVLPQDLDGLVHRHADGETQQQAGGDCAAGEKQKSRSHVTHVTASPGKQEHQVKRMATERKCSHLSRIVRGLRSS